jgi:photosystem II stability/assembly factor-like uncharacterized protein
VRTRLALVALAACTRHAAAPAPPPAWTWLNPRPTGNDLRGAFVDGARAWAVGDAGTIVRSDDGGASWTLVPSGTSEPLRGVTGDRGGVVVVGGHGTILASTDGATFTAQHSPTAMGLTAVWANGHGRIFAVGDHGTILVSTNGGASWTVLPSGTSADLYAVRGASDDHVYAAGAGTLLAAEGDAATWHERPTGTEARLTALDISPKGDRVTAVGEDVLLRSTDHGATFSSEPTPGGVPFLAVEGELFAGTAGRLVRAGRPLPAGDLTLHAVAGSMVFGELGTILRVGADGIDDATPGPRANLYAIATRGDEVVAVGDRATIFAGPPLHVVPHAAAHLTGVALAGGHTDVASQYGFERDGRQVGPAQPLRAVAADRRTLVLTADAIYEEGDTGWTKVFDADLAAIWTEGPLAVAVGRGGQIVRSAAPGDFVATLQPGDWRAVAGRGAEVWVVGAGGAALRSTDGGRHFAPVVTGVDVLLLGVSVGDDVVIVGDHGTILAGTGGALAREASGTTRALTAVSGRYAVGAGGAVLERQKSR